MNHIIDQWLSEARHQLAVADGDRAYTYAQLQVTLVLAIRRNLGASGYCDTLPEAIAENVRIQAGNCTAGPQRNQMRMLARQIKQGGIPALCSMSHQERRQMKRAMR